MWSPDEVEDMETDTQWEWYYLGDCGQWHQFEDDPNDIITQDLEEYYRRNPRGTQSITSSRGISWVDFKAMTIKDTTGKERKIKRHFNIERSCSCFVAAPDLWDSVDPKRPFQLINLTENTEEFNTVEDYVKNNGLLDKTIVSIRRIQNLDLWEFYCRKRKQLTRIHKGRDLQERRIFHGTDGKNIEAICKYNFDLRLAGDNGRFGRGIYFARYASYAHKYTYRRDITPNQEGQPCRYIILARVIVGKSTEGEKNIRKPDRGLENEHNSCVDKIDHPTIFVIFDPNQIYPEYLIKYRT